MPCYASSPTSTHHNKDFACSCLARLERSCAGECVDEASGALSASSRQRSEDLPSTRALWGFITAGDFAGDHRGTQLAFGQVISSIHAIVIEEGKEVIALFIKPIAHRFFAGFAAGRLQ